MYVQLLKMSNYCRTKLFTTQPQILMTLRKKPFENLVGIGENAGS